MAVVFYKDTNGNFVEIPVSGVSASQVQEAVNTYLQENPVNIEETDPTVPDWAKQPNKPTYTAEEVGAYSKEETNTIHTGLEIRIGGLENNVSKKANQSELDMVVVTKATKANTLAGYGINDAYTKDEVNNLISSAIGEALEGDY